MKPEVLQLERIDWQIFGTITSAQWEVSPTRWHKISFAVFREFAERTSAFFPALPWVLRYERGEITQKAHVHFLLGGLNPRKVTRNLMFQMMHRLRPPHRKQDGSWDLADDSMKVGWSRFRIFNQRLAGVDYVTKCLSGLAANDEYEFRKFGGDLQELTLSRGLCNLLAMKNRELGRKV